MTFLILRVLSFILINLIILVSSELFYASRLSSDKTHQNSEIKLLFLPIYPDEQKEKAIRIPKFNGTEIMKNNLTEDSTTTIEATMEPVTTTANITIGTTEPYSTEALLTSMMTLDNFEHTTEPITEISEKTTAPPTTTTELPPIGFWTMWPSSQGEDRTIGAVQGQVKNFSTTERESNTKLEEQQLVLSNIFNNNTSIENLTVYDNIQKSHLLNFAKSRTHLSSVTKSIFPFISVPFTSQPYLLRTEMPSIEFNIQSEFLDRISKSNLQEPTIPKILTTTPVSETETLQSDIKMNNNLTVKISIKKEDISATMATTISTNTPFTTGTTALTTAQKKLSQKLDVIPTKPPDLSQSIVKKLTEIKNSEKEGDAVKNVLENNQNNAVALMIKYLLNKT